MPTTRHRRTRTQAGMSPTMLKLGGRITPEAIDRWREIGRDGFGGRPGELPFYIEDEALAKALGLPSLLAHHPDNLQALARALDALAEG